MITNLFLHSSERFNSNLNNLLFISIANIKVKYFVVADMVQEYFAMDKIHLHTRVNGIWVICMEKYVDVSFNYFV